MQTGFLSANRPLGALWSGLTLLLLLTSCNVDRAVRSIGEWTIDTDEVMDGGPGKDGIPALSDPPMVGAAEITYLQPEDLVVVYRSGDDIQVFPHRIMDWHEIANVTIGADKLAITYCPLTGSALAWNRVINGEATTFGVSGLLYRNNLVPYDRATDSYWSQLRMEAVHGELIERRPEVYQVIETTWQTWQQMYPDSRVADAATGVYSPEQYDRYPYGRYRENTQVLQPIKSDLWDSRLHPKERVVGIVTGSSARVYRLSSFADSVRAFHDVYNDNSLVVVGSAADNFMMIFNRQLQDGTVLDFTAAQARYPVVMVDQEGNDWDLFGRAVGGPRTGEQLSHPTTFIAYWLAWFLFYPDSEIFEFPAS